MNIKTTMGIGLVTVLGLGQSTVSAAFITGPGDPDYTTLFIGMGESGYLKVDGKFITLTADKDSTELPLATQL